ncbi:MAG TPA: DUF302 domain-containing protein [Candidatus Eremiobacteraceae bacterium]|nr:DUF302 domain-containing protein [Candidatus Eremiobacteraceae bacterium]
MIAKPRYGNVVATDLPFEAAVARAKELLKAEGFGVLCEIDVSRTLKEKIGADFRPYVILGACNPTLAHEALCAESQLGLLLPCNVVVQQEASGVIVSAIDARVLLDVVGRPELSATAADVNARLSRVLEQIAA